MFFEGNGVHARRFPDSRGFAGHPGTIQNAVITEFVNA